MRFETMGMLLVGTMSIAGTAAAQNTPAPPATARTVIAATKLPKVSDAPVYFSVASVELAPGLTSSVSKANGILYQLSGSTEASVAGEVKMSNPGEGLFIGAGKTATLKAGGAGPSTFLHFFLVPAADLAAPAETALAVVKEAYRTPAPIPDLRPGGYDLNLTRVTFPAGMPSNAPHHRSGAALYYVLSGAGANTIDGKVISRTTGSFIYEPFGLVHQWGNPGDQPLTFITFNISPEGVAAVLPGTPAKTQ
jgi:quercetin dioxygenase-like cupin family protein